MLSYCSPHCLLTSIILTEVCKSVLHNHQVRVLWWICCFCALKGHPSNFTHHMWPLMMLRLFFCHQDHFVISVQTWHLNLEQKGRIRNWWCGLKRAFLLLGWNFSAIQTIHGGLESCLFKWRSYFSNEPPHWSILLFYLQHYTLPGRAERLHAPGDVERGTEDGVSRGRGASLLPVTGGQVFPGCKWGTAGQLRLIPGSLLSHRWLFCFNTAERQLRRHEENIREGEIIMDENTSAVRSCL